MTRYLHTFGRDASAVTSHFASEEHRLIAFGRLGSSGLVSARIRPAFIPRPVPSRSVPSRRRMGSHQRFWFALVPTGPPVQRSGRSGRELASQLTLPKSCDLDAAVAVTGDPKVAAYRAAASAGVGRHPLVSSPGSRSEHLAWSQFRTVLVDLGPSWGRGIPVTRGERRCMAVSVCAGQDQFPRDGGGQKTLAHTSTTSKSGCRGTCRDDSNLVSDLRKHHRLVRIVASSFLSILRTVRGLLPGSVPTARAAPRTASTSRRVAVWARRGLVGP
jgi:hypothetical protein